MCERCLLFGSSVPEGVLCGQCADDLGRELGRRVAYANLEAFWFAHRQVLNELRTVDLTAASLDRRALRTRD